MLISRKNYNPNYKGLKIMANPDLHVDVMKYISENYKLDINILILASGTGSFDKRLFDSGYKNITSVDINFDNYEYKNKKVDFINLDLNTDFSQKINKKFDLVIGLEIIEHVYGPYSFISNVKKVLKVNGEFIVSTPNVHNYCSKINFAMFGYPTLFIVKPSLFEHVSPILDNVLNYYAGLCGMQIMKRIPSSNYFKYMIYDSIKGFLWHIMMIIASVVLFPLLILSKLFHGNLDKGLISIYVIKNDKK